MKRGQKMSRIFKIKGLKDRENLRAIHLNGERCSDIDNCFKFVHVTDKSKIQTTLIFNLQFYLLLSERRFSPESCLAI